MREGLWGRSKQSRVVNENIRGRGVTPILPRGEPTYRGDRCTTRTRAFLLIWPHKPRAWTRVLGEVAMGTGTF